MIKIFYGDIFQSNAEALVCPVNHKGIMGAGLALEFDRRFPSYGKSYREACKGGALYVEGIHVFRDKYYPTYIISFPTKTHWKLPSTFELIDAGLKRLVREVDACRITSVAIPALGCGRGGLSWNVVREAIKEAFQVLPEVDVKLFAPLYAAPPEPHLRPCIRCGHLVPDRSCGTKAPCSDCGCDYPLGDCSD